MDQRYPFKVFLHRKVLMFSLYRFLVLILFLLLPDSQLCDLILESSLCLCLRHLIVSMIIISLLFVMVIDNRVTQSGSQKCWESLLIVVFTHSLAVIEEVSTHIKRLCNRYVLRIRLVYLASFIQYSSSRVLETCSQRVELITRAPILILQWLKFVILNNYC